MAIIVIAIAFVSASCWSAIRANARFRDEDQLPMQWWLTGEVTWSAPRILALSFVPVLAALVLGFDAWAALTLKSRPGQEGFVLPVLLVIGVAFLAIQYFHHWMIERSIKRNGS